MTAPGQRCVAERRRAGAEIWHLAGAAGDEHFQPIACRTGQGIIDPGTLTRRRPTCRTCLQLLGADAAELADAGA